MSKFEDVWVVRFAVQDVDWGELDYLVIDTPPGTSDEHMSVVKYLEGCNVDGAVVVTTPQVYMYICACMSLRNRNNGNCCQL